MKILKTSVMLVVSASLLAGCGGNPAPDPLESFRTQTLDWQSCDPSILGRSPARYEERFKALGSRLQCADMRAPLDWNNPSKGEVSVMLIRTAAADKAARQGVIFFNPGGPGGDGLSFAPNYAYAWGNAKPDTEAGRSLNAMQAQFDLIGFSPRGVGNSTRLYCGLNEMSVPYYNASGDRSEANIQKMIRSGQLNAKACQRNPVTPYINTEATVQDMDLARQLLGEQKLNYIGYSYGTWLGSWYAKRFPEHTGRMLLDGNMPWHGPMQTNWETDPLAFTRAFTDVAAPYLARHDGEFGLGKDPQRIYQNVLGLSEPLRTSVRSSLSGLLYGAADYPVIGVTVRVALELDHLLAANPKAKDHDLLAALSEQDLFADKELNDVALEVAAELLQSRAELLAQAPTKTFLNESSGTMAAVMCNDTPWTTDLNYWRDLDAKNAQAYPLFGGDLIAINCIHWKGGPTVQKPEVPSNMPSLLMLQNEYDPATPVEGAVNALNSVPDGRMILIDNEPSHAAFPYGSDCVDLPILNYFLTGKLPEAKMNYCQALPLPGEDVVFNAGHNYMGPASLSGQSLSSAATLPAEAQAALQENRNLIQQNAIQFKAQ